MIDNYSSIKSSRFNFLSKSSLIITAKILIATGLLYYLISSVKYEQIIIAIKEANISIILVVVGLGVLNVFLQYLKWKLTCTEVLGVTDNSKVFRSLFYGFSAGIITPLRIGEYFGRGIEFRDRSLVQVTVATLVDKFFPLLIVALLGSMLSLLFIYIYYNVSIYLILALFSLIFTFFYILILLLINPGFWSNIFFSRINSSTKLKPFFDKLRVFRRLDRKYFVKMLVISFLFYLCFLIQYALLVSAFSNHFDILNYLWAANLIMFAKTIIPPISFGELGIREGASVYFITQMGQTASVGFNASIFLFIINLLIPALIGVGMFLRKNDN